VRCALLSARRRFSSVKRRLEVEPNLERGRGMLSSGVRRNSKTVATIVHHQMAHRQLPHRTARIGQQGLDWLLSFRLIPPAPGDSPFD
jgi:hypothetical protein